MQPKGDSTDPTRIVPQLLRCIESAKTTADLQFVSQVIADYKHSRQQFLATEALNTLRAAVVARSKVLNV